MKKNEVSNVTKKRIFGVSIIALVLLGLYIATGMVFGFFVSSIIWLINIGLTALIVFGAYLIQQ